MQEMLDMAVHFGHLLEGTELRSHTQRKAWFLKVWFLCILAGWY